MTAKVFAVKSIFKSDTDTTLLDQAKIQFILKQLPSKSDDKSRVRKFTHLN